MWYLMEYAAIPMAYTSSSIWVFTTEDHSVAVNQIKNDPM